MSIPLDRSILVRLFGNAAAFLHGDTLVLDRWRWLRQRLPRTRNGEKLIDVGCGTGAFTIGAALRGYDCIGLSWDVRNQTVAQERAEICGAKLTSFPIQDVRKLDERAEYSGIFDVALCLECIEHISDDRKLMAEIFRCLKPGGMLYLTTPNYFYRPMEPREQGPFSRTEDGWHVRRGYTATMLRELCQRTGFEIEEIGYCSGFFSQKVTGLIRKAHALGPLGWLLTTPLRALPLLFDNLISKISGWPGYCIFLVAYKPRFLDQQREA